MMVFNLKNVKKLIVCIAIPLLAGFLGSLLGGRPEIYSSINVPNFAPPSILFPVVWTILYTLMGISCYLIDSAKKNGNSSIIEEALKVYYIQLLVDSLWSLIFFRFQLFFFAWIWIIILILLVAYMIFLFYKIDKRAALLQIPYIIWLIFASILNFAIFSLN